MRSGVVSRSASVRSSRRSGTPSPAESLQACPHSTTKRSDATCARVERARQRPTASTGRRPDSTSASAQRRPKLRSPTPAFAALPLHRGSPERRDAARSSHRKKKVCVAQQKWTPTERTRILNKEVSCISLFSFLLQKGSGALYLSPSVDASSLRCTWVRSAVPTVVLRFFCHRSDGVERQGAGTRGGKVA